MQHGSNRNSGLGCRMGCTPTQCIDQYLHWSNVTLTGFGTWKRPVCDSRTIAVEGTSAYIPPLTLYCCHRRSISAKPDHLHRLLPLTLSQVSWWSSVLRHAIAMLRSRTRLLLTGGSFWNSIPKSLGLANVSAAHVSYTVRVHLWASEWFEISRRAATKHFASQVSYTCDNCIGT
jgi:hypothetical protein